MENKELLTVKQAHKENPDFSEQKINFAIRQGLLKAKKLGTKYYFSRSAWNEYLGVPVENETLKKDLRIKELEGEVKEYRMKLEALKNIIHSINNIAGL